MGRGEADGWEIAGEVVAAAGVRPVFGLDDEAAGDRVAMHVVELLQSLLPGEDVEVVVTGLPKGLGVGLL